MQTLQRSRRDSFPALAGSTIYLDNAGGSQMPSVVADAMHQYMTTTFVQTGADYDESVRATRTVKHAHDFLHTFMHTAGTGHVVIGPSTSQLCRTLSESYAEILKAGDEIVLCETAHESNAGPWARLEKLGVNIKWWRLGATASPHEAIDAQSAARMDQLAALLTPRTRIVAFPQVSNILGQIIDVPRVVRLVRERSPHARIICDGVAYAPHLPIDVAGWGVDWYLFSTYKVFGPHAAVLFGTHEAFAEVTGPNHGFIPREELPRKFELGGANHESCAGILSLDTYLARALGEQDPAPDAAFCRQRVERAMHAFEALERPLCERLLDFLRNDPRVRIIGPTTNDRRVCTVSFVHTRGKSSRDIAQALNAQGLGVRYGTFYAHRLCVALGLDPADGVVRASLAHYNTMEEIERLIATLRDVL